MDSVKAEAKQAIRNAKVEGEQIAKESLHVASEAVQSKGYLYPPYGLLYLVRSRSLWPIVTGRLASCFALTIAVVIPMFFFTYIPQAAVLTLMNGPMGPINAILLVLSESTAIVNALAKAFLLEDALVDVFDATLLQEGQAGLVGNGRELKRGVSTMNGVAKLGKMVTKPLHQASPQALMRYVMLLPLNLVPFVGTALFIITQGRRVGPDYHARYFQLKGFSTKQREEFIQRNQAGYLAFGTISTVMNLVPFASILFNFTSTIGGALWAADLEKKSDVAKKLI